MSTPQTSHDSSLKKETNNLDISTTSPVSSEIYADTTKRSWFTNLADGFKPMNMDHIDPNLTDLEKANLIAKEAPVERSMKPRHLKMIALGSCIGTGLFIGTGTALRTGGPAALLISFSLIGIQVYCTVQSLAELAVAYPAAGSFVQYATRFISPSWGFATAWLYTINWMIVMPLELVAASLTIKFWNESVNSAAWVVIFYVFIFFVHFFGAKAYGEAEFIFSLIKLICVIGYIILGIVLNCGGGPDKTGYIGGKYWKNPGAFANGFKGVASVFLTAAFSLQGTEMAGLAASETSNPKKSIPSATKQVFWRVVIFYLVCLTLLGLLVPFNDPRLLGSNSADASASPFVISIKNAGIKGLPSVVNVVIMLSVTSVGNTAVFACSRCVASLAHQGFAPKIFGYMDREGRPLAGLIVAMVFGLLCFLAASPDEATIFAWLLSLSGLSTVFSWSSICMVHLRFRWLLKSQGRTVDELGFVAQTGTIGSVFSILISILTLAFQFWIAVFPFNAKPNAIDFFQNYLTVPVWLFLYAFYALWKKDFRLWIKAEDMDIDEGRRELDIDLIHQEHAEEKEFIQSQPFYYRCYKFWC